MFPLIQSLHLFFLIIFLFQLNDAITRNDSQPRGIHGVTVIFTMSQSNRIDFAVSTLIRYHGPSYHHIIKDIIVLWNNPYLQVPRELLNLKDTLVIARNSSSLNNRWILGNTLFMTDAVVIQDDDMYALPSVFECLLSAWVRNPQRLISSIVRRIENLQSKNGRYLMNPLEARNASYNLAISMIMMSSANLQQYHKIMTPPMLDYLYTQKGSCDDIAINMIATSHTGLPPLRILPDAKSLYFYNDCSKSTESASDSQRAKHRTMCSRHLSELISSSARNSSGHQVRILQDTTEVNFCSSNPNRIAAYNSSSTNINDPAARKFWLKSSITCHESSKNAEFILDTIPYSQLKTILEAKKYRVGIVANEFWSIQIDKRKGGFGFASYMVSRTFLDSTGDNEVAVIFLHASAVSKGNQFDKVAMVHDTPILLQQPESYEKLLQSLKIDMLISVDFRDSYMSVIRHIPGTPLVLWAHDPHSQEISNKIRSISIPKLGGSVNPKHVTPFGSNVPEVLAKHFGGVLIAVTTPYFRPFFHRAYHTQQVSRENFVAPQLPYAMDAFDNTVEQPTTRLPHPTPRVICTGRLDPVKRPWIVVAVARAIPEVEFLMLGNLFTTVNPLGFGHSADSLQPPNLKLLGHVEGIEKRKLIASSWVLISTSIHEGLPFNFIEALQSGVPLVATQNPENMTSNFGIYVGNYANGSGLEAVAPLAAAIRKLISDTKLRLDLGDSGRRWVETEHSVSSFLLAFNQLRLRVKSGDFTFRGVRPGPNGTRNLLEF